MVVRYLFFLLNYPSSSAIMELSNMIPTIRYTQHQYVLLNVDSKKTTTANQVVLHNDLCYVAVVVVFVQHSWKAIFLLFPNHDSVKFSTVCCRNAQSCILLFQEISTSLVISNIYLNVERVLDSLVVDCSFSNKPSANQDFCSIFSVGETPQTLMLSPQVLHSPAVLFPTLLWQRRNQLAFLVIVSLTFGVFESWLFAFSGNVAVCWFTQSTSGD